MLRRLTRGAAAVGLLAVLAACAPQPGSTAAVRSSVLTAGIPGWRVMGLLPNLTAGGLWAGGARDAWLAGDACADPATCGADDTSNGTLVVRHWDGTSWRAVAPPRSYVGTPLDQGAGPVAGTSATSVWIAAYRGSESVDRTDMLHWTGRRWTAPVPLPTMIQAAVAPSAGQLWAFGDGTKPGQTGYVAHFTGRTWTFGSFPLSATAAAALSPADVWAGGITATGRPGMEHWDGREWQATPLPDLRPGARAPFGVAIEGIAAVKPDDVWADVSDLGSSLSNRQGAFLLHWNGRAWKRVAFPYAGLAYSPVTTDGRGGLWLVLAPKDDGMWFCHYSAGRWTRTLVPGSSVPRLIAWIPGTSSQWAAGDVSGLAVGTAILKYGT
jgi:hypothetical protein